MKSPQTPDFRVKTDAEKAQNRLLIRLLLTRAGLICERGVRAFWPVWSVVFTGCAALMFGIQDYISLFALRIVVTLGTFALLLSLIKGTRNFRMPTLAEARDRLDQTVIGRPLATLADRQSIGSQDTASRTVWKIHQARMRDAADKVRTPQPDLKISNLDPFGLRYSALLVFILALIFGTPWRLSEISTVAQGRPPAVQTGPSWEGWIDPPTYTGLPTLYLNDQPPGLLSLVEGSELFLRLYSESGGLSIEHSIAEPVANTDPSATEHRVVAQQDGILRIDGAPGAEWQISLIPDAHPTITITDEPDIALSGEMRLPFRATDDYGVVNGIARLTLEKSAVDRRHGLAADPEPRDEITLDLPLTISGDRRDFDEVLIDNLSKHPWAGLPVRLQLSVTDAAGQTTQSDPISLTLPGRRFFELTAKAVVEQRRDLLWTRDNAERIAQLLRAASHRADDIFDDASNYLMWRTAIRQLESLLEPGLTPDDQDELSEVLWQIAIQIEDGDIGDALDRLRQAQERLRQAMRDGASDQEIAELMQELRGAVSDYMRQLAQNPESTIDQPNSGDAQTLTQQDLQEMMDRIQELIEQGRMAEAEQLMRQLQQMMENLRMTDQPGQNGQGEGQQSLEDLSKTLREQQGLSDEAFRQLQEQFNSGPLAGQSQNNPGQSGTDGSGQRSDGRGRGSTGDDGSGRDGMQPGQNPSDGEGAGQSLADRQQALRDELRRQEQGLPGMGGDQGDATREALDRAGRAMDDAEQSLRDQDFAEALNNQAQALEALREGMRNLSEALSQGQNQAGAQNGEGQASSDQRDPLGRSQGAEGALGSQEGLEAGEDVYRRARDLLDKLRKRTTDQERSKRELDYLKRLLDRF